MTQLVEVNSGINEEGVHWQLCLTDDLPEGMQYTGAFDVAFTPDEHIILMDSRKRGWGLVGGHPERQDKGDIRRTLWRESLEEGGFMPENPRLFAVRWYIRGPESHPGRRKYPDNSFIAFYHDVIHQQLRKPTGKDTRDRRPFTLEAARALELSDQQLIDLGHAARFGAGA